MGTLFLVILGTIVWAVVMGFLSSKVTIFASLWGWVVSWFVVVFLVMEIFGR